LFRRYCHRHCRWSFRSFIHHGFHTFHFPASLGSTLVTRFLATTDALTPAGRLFGPLAMNTVLFPGRSPCLPRSRFLPFCLQPPTDGTAAFLSFTVLSAYGCCPVGLPALRAAPLWEARASGRTSHSARRLAPSFGRIEFTSLHDDTYIQCYGLAVHLRQLSTPCRHDAVAFGHRPVILRPDGDFHPAM
jgi:hypothetical protein